MTEHCTAIKFEAMAPLVEQTETNSDLSLDTNVKGVFFCLKHEIRLMKEAGGGAIVNQSSIAGLRGIPDNSLYSASKHAVIGLTKAAALENAGFGIRINALCPSAIDGAMLRGIMENRGLSEERCVVLLVCHALSCLIGWPASPPPVPYA